MVADLKTMFVEMSGLDPSMAQWRSLADAAAPHLVRMMHARLHRNPSVPVGDASQWHELVPLAVMTFLDRRMTDASWRAQFRPEDPRCIGYVLQGIWFEIKAQASQLDDGVWEHAEELQHDRVHAYLQPSSVESFTGIEGDEEQAVEIEFLRLLHGFLDRVGESPRRQVLAFLGAAQPESRNDPSYGRRRCFGLWLVAESEIARRRRPRTLDDVELDLARDYGAALGETADFARTEAEVVARGHAPERVSNRSANFKETCGQARPHWLGDIQSFVVESVFRRSP